MTFNEYQQKAWETALPTAKSLEYMILGLCNEAGEVAGKYKKRLRDGNITDEDILAEISDCLWYIAGAVSILKGSLDSVAEYNVNKLQSRKERGVLGGSGDTR